MNQELDSTLFPHPALPHVLLLQQNMKGLWIPTGEPSPKTPRWISLCPLFLSYNNYRTPTKWPQLCKRTLKRGNGQCCLGTLEGSGTFLKVLLRPSMSPGQDGRHQSRPCLMLYNSSIPTGRFYTWEATDHRGDALAPNGYSYSHSAHALHLNLKLLPSALSSGFKFLFFGGGISFNSYMLYY